jgi:hypothetical protein
MMQARFNLITMDPLRLGDSVWFIETEVRPAVERLDGSLGLSLYTNPELGVAVLESYWVSRDTLRASEHQVSASRQAAVRRAVGTVSVERYRVPVCEREIPLRTGAGLRLTRMDIDPANAEEAAEVYGATAVPSLAETDGFCAALLFLDRRTGHSIGETIWLNPQRLAASRSAAAAVRVETVALTGCVIRAVEEYGLVFSSARNP